MRIGDDSLFEIRCRAYSPLSQLQDTNIAASEFSSTRVIILTPPLLRSQALARRASYLFPDRAHMPGVVSPSKVSSPSLGSCYSILRRHRLRRIDAGSCVCDEHDVFEPRREDMRRSHR